LTIHHPGYCLFRFDLQVTQLLLATIPLPHLRHYKCYGCVAKTASGHTAKSDQETNLHFLGVSLSAV
jgi:hypothetical protein